ncbi:MAG: hypothetical protein WC426_02620 [Sulfuriferula sp.]
MSDSTSLLTQLTTSQAGKEATVNELMNAASPATVFGRRQSSSGLAWDYFGGRFNANGTLTAIANGTLTLTASTTCYIEVNPAGTVSFNTTGFTAGNIPLYSVVTGASTVTSYADYRNFAFSFNSGGSTASRPAKPLLYQMFFDTTLGIPVWCQSLSPNIWVNSAGVTV